MNNVSIPDLQNTSEHPLAERLKRGYPLLSGVAVGTTLICLTAYPQVYDNFTTYACCAGFASLVTSLFVWLGMGRHDDEQRARFGPIPFILSIIFTSGVAMQSIGGYVAGGQSQVFHDAADRVEFVGDFISQIAGQFESAEPIAQGSQDFSSGFFSGLNEMADEVYESTYPALREEGLRWGCLLGGVFAGASLFFSRLARRTNINTPESQVLLVTSLASVLGYVVIEWFSGAKMLLGALILGLLICLVQTTKEKDRSLFETMTTIMPWALLAGLGLDLVFGSESLWWKATLAAGCGASAFTTAYLTSSNLDWRTSYLVGWLKK